MKKLLIVSLLFQIGVTFAATHQAAPQAASSPEATTQTTVSMTEGEVRKVDKSARKITLKHGEIKNLEMPPMTMVFQVKDVTLLDKVNVGDKIRFSAEQVNGALFVTAIDLAK